MLPLVSSLLFTTGMSAATRGLTDLDAFSDESVRALAMSGSLDRTSLNAVFVGARWIGDDVGLAHGPLGQHFGSRLTLHNFEIGEGECERQRAAIAARPAELRVVKEVCHMAAIDEFVCNEHVAGTSERCVDGTVPFYVQRELVCSSLLRPSLTMMRRVGLDTVGFGCGDVQKVIRVSTTTIDTHFAPGSIDYLKLDVQGADLAVMRGGKAALSEVMFAQIEVEFVEVYEGQPLFADVDTFARKELGLTFAGFVDGALSVRNPARSKLTTSRDDGGRMMLHGAFVIRCRACLFGPRTPPSPFIIISSSSLKQTADALYIRDVLPTPGQGSSVRALDNGVADPATFPYDVELRDRILRMCAVASAHGIMTITVEGLDWLQRWLGAPWCVRARAALAIHLIPAGLGLDVSKMGAAHTEAAALLAAFGDGTARATQHRCRSSITDPLPDLDAIALIRRAIINTVSGERAFLLHTRCLLASSFSPSSLSRALTLSLSILSLSLPVTTPVAQHGCRCRAAAWR